MYAQFHIISVSYKQENVTEFLIEWWENYDLLGNTAVIENYKPSWIAATYVSELNKG